MSSGNKKTNTKEVDEIDKIEGVVFTVRSI